MNQALPAPSDGCTIRFREELAHGANAGLLEALTWLEPVKQRHPNVTYADLISFAGTVSIAAMGGPSVPWRSGRIDALTPDAVTPDGRLPAADKGNPAATAAGLREVFGRMGFDDREIVALSGAHSLGRCHPEASGYVGPWTPTPTVRSRIPHQPDEDTFSGTMGSHRGSHLDAGVLQSIFQATS